MQVFTAILPHQNYNAWTCDKLKLPRTEVGVPCSILIHFQIMQQTDYDAFEISKANISEAWREIQTATVTKYN